ncbi:hypothetical protein [Streptomyces spiralis]|uniref:hypothetical protein n=1 Tax=Streptomyces spiralis TaxID=66376 RepID=UPI0033F1218F
MHETVAAAHGHAASHAWWRVVGMMHLAETVETARRDVSWGILRSTRYFEGLTGRQMPWRCSPEAAVDQWIGDGLPGWGTAVVGTPDEAIAHLERLLDQTGGFGTFLRNVHGCAPPQATRRSYELFAEYLIPYFRRANRARTASLEWARDNSERFLGSMNQAIEQAKVTYAP